MLYKNNSYITIEVSNNFKFGTIVPNIKKYDSSSIFGYNKNFSSTEYINIYKLILFQFYFFNRTYFSE